MPVEELAEHVERWRAVDDGAPRLRVVADTARTLRDLSDTERRVLARGVAERGLPELATRIGQPAGLSADEARRGARALLAMDGGSLDALAADLRSPDGRRRLLGEAEQLAGHLPSPDATAQVVDLPPPSSGSRIDAPPPTPEPAEPDLAPAAPVEDDLAPEPAGDLADTEPGLGVTDTEPAVDVPARDPEVEHGPVVRPHRPTDGPGRHHDVGAASITAATSARDRLAALHEAVDDGLDGRRLVALLRHVPDGWERRRAARRLLASHRVRDVDAHELLTLFGRDVDRVAVASALVEDDLAVVGAVVDALPAPAAARLERRAARRG